MNKKISIGLISTDWGINKERKDNNHYGGVTYYRLIKPLLENPSEEFEFKYYGANLHEEAVGKTAAEFWDEFTDRHDVYIIKHVDNPEPASNLTFFCKKKNKTIIMDMDDNLLEVKPDQPAWEFYKPGSEKRSYVSALMSMMDAMFVSTKPLADYYKNYLKKVYNVEMPTYILPNYNDIADWNYEKVKNDTNKITVGWIGSTTHNNDLKIVLPAINRLLKENSNLQFLLIGGVSHETAPDLFESMDEDVLDRVFCQGGTQSWQGYPEFLSKQHIDIGIAPLTEDEFNRGKSHIKWMEYAMYKVPCVASRVYPYQMDILGKDTIRQGETGFLCDKKEWYKTLKKLIENKELRETIGSNAYNYVKENLQYKDHYKLWDNALSEIIWE